MFKLGAVSLGKGSATVAQVTRTWRADEARPGLDLRSWLVAVSVVLAVALFGATPFATGGDPATLDGASALLDGAPVLVGAPAHTVVRAAVGTESAVAPIPQNALAIVAARARSQARLWLLSLLVIAGLIGTLASGPRAGRRDRGGTHADLLVLLPGRRGPPTRH